MRRRPPWFIVAKTSFPEDKKIIRTWTGCLAVCLAAFFAPACMGQQMQVLVDQVGYEARAPKQALVMGKAQEQPQAFTLLDAATGKTVFTGTLTAAGQVHAWNGTYWVADFSSWQKPGHYLLQTKTAAGEVSSCPFEIADDVLERNTLSNVLYYFKGQRSSGLIDQADRHLPLPGGEQGFVDVHGGWYDATGDYGIHFSHQNLTSYFNPQQTPLVVWSLLKSYGALQARQRRQLHRVRTAVAG